MALEDIDKNFSKISQAQDTNFENNKNTIECCTDLENVESESATTNEQTVPGCGLGSDKELDISCNVGKHPIKIVGEESDAEENLTNSANTLTEEIQQSLNNTENSLLYDTCNTASYESVCTEHTSDCLETLNTTHKNLRKRNTSNSEVSKHVAKSGEEIVIRHEHCEKLDNVSTDNSFQDTGIVSAKNQLPMYSNQELKNTSSQKPVDLPVHSVQDSTQNSTTGLYIIVQEEALCVQLYRKVYKIFILFWTSLDICYILYLPDHSNQTYSIKDITDSLKSPRINNYTNLVVKCS